MITNHITSSVGGINASYYTSLAETFGRLFILVLGLSMYYTLPIVYGLTSKRRTLLLCVILWQIWTLISSNHQKYTRVFVEYQGFEPYFHFGVHSIHWVSFFITRVCNLLKLLRTNDFYILAYLGFGRRSKSSKTTARIICTHITVQGDVSENKVNRNTFFL